MRLPWRLPYDFMDGVGLHEEGVQIGHFSERVKFCVLSWFRV